MIHPRALSALAAIGVAALFVAPAAAQQAVGRSSTLCPEVAQSARERACQEAEVAQAEVRLAATWKRVFARFGGSADPSGKALLAGQRAWIGFKDKACAVYFLPRLSALEWSNGQRCKAAVIDDRIAELERLENDFPGED